MKKLLIVLAAVFMALAMLVGCGDVEEKIAYDSENHWFEGKEDIKSAHTFDDGTVIKEPTETETGTIEYKCTICGYTKTQTLPVKSQHTHTFDTENWEKSETEHWHKATCEHTTEVDGKAAHDFVTKVTKTATETEKGTVEYTCSVCGYKKTAEIDYANHEHIEGWNATRGEHTAYYVCCGQPAQDLKAGAHTYNNGTTCTVCGKYSVLEDVRLQMKASGLFDRIITIESFEMPMPEEEESATIKIENLAIKIGLDENYKLVGVGKMKITMEKNVPTKDNPTAKVVTESAEFEVVIHNDTVFVKAVSTGDKVLVIEGNSTSGGISGSYGKFDLKTIFGGTEVLDVYEAILDELYLASDTIKSLLATEGGNIDAEKLLALFNTFFKETDEKGVYTLDLSALKALNEKGKDITVGDILKAVTGKDDYGTVINAYIDTILGTTIGDIIDKLKEQGVDIHELNAAVNEILVKYTDMTIEQLLASNGINFLPSGTTLAKFIDSDLVRAYTLLDIINMVMPEAKLTVEQVKEVVKQYTDMLEGQKVYDLIAIGINMIIEKNTSGSSDGDTAGEEEPTATITVTGTAIYTAIDRLITLVEDAFDVTVRINEKFEVSEVTIKLEIDNSKYTVPETSEETDPAVTIIYAFEAQVRSLLAMLKGTVAIKANGTVDVDEAKLADEINAKLDKHPTIEALEEMLNKYYKDATINVTKKDGRDYVEIEYTDDSYFYDDHLEGGYVICRYKVKMSGYLDEMFISVSYEDICGDDFCAYFGYSMACEISDVRFVKFVDKEITAEELETVYEFCSDKIAKILAKTIDRDSRCFTYKDGKWGAFYSEMHNYELKEGSIEDINAETYTLLKYVCKDSDCVYYIYCKGDINKDYLPTTE